MVLETQLTRSLCFGLLCRLHTEAGNVQFDDHAVMHEAIDGRGCGHLVLEHLVPFAEGKVACQQHAPTPIDSRQQWKIDTTTLSHFSR